MNESPIASVQNVSKTYQQGSRDVSALQDVSLDIGQGSFVAIMGASGSGKSTLMHLMCGLTRPNAGTVTIANQNLADLSDRDLTLFRRAKIGLVFQAFNLVPSLTAQDNILFPLFAAGRDFKTNPDPLDPDPCNNDQKVAKIAERLSITDRLSHLPDSLSGGEQQRVAIARSLITNPAIIFADEPTGSLDSDTGQSICQLLRELCDQQGRTIVVVTHEPNVAIWADDVVVLKDGRIIDQFPTNSFETPQALAAHYQAATNTQHGGSLPSETNGQINRDGQKNAGRNDDTFTSKGSYELDQPTAS
ncbi:ABC transporter ATP-binding protein [Neorhodopirellula lusitana]|uniref:ABC transporter ATP-binding protein n=1 Tax=Neorhodopirellula lusitana TaxID=445327 RepID=UPI00384F4D22